MVRFIRVRWINSARPLGRRVHSDAPWVSSGSFGFVGFIWARPGGRRVHSGSLGSFGRTLCVVRFIRARWVDSGVPLVSSG